MKPNDNHFDPRPGLPLSFDGEAGLRLLQHYSWDLNADDKNLIEVVGSCSPFLSRLMVRYPEFTQNILHNNLDNIPSPAEGSITVEDVETLDRSAKYLEYKKTLRTEKNKTALSIALRDLGMKTSVMAAARDLSIFADEVVERALNIAVSCAIERGQLNASSDLKGLVIIAMGKHGASELNYSSDIDLIALFDPERLNAKDPHDPKKVAIKVVQEAIDLLSDQTGDGYVFRTDLRLRPDPGVSPIVISLSAAETYYELYGQNWERAAFIKARAVAGDIELGNIFLERMRPFIWRKYLDYAAIEDIQAVRKKILQTQKSTAMDFEGFNVKLGVGGIREIEFLVQTHQLVAGGKNPTLRCRNTLEAIDALFENGFFSAPECQNLKEAYQSLRFIEHRIQMLHDEQTHKIPTSDSDIDRLARFCGFEHTAAFKDYVAEVREKAIEGQQGTFSSVDPAQDKRDDLAFNDMSDSKNAQTLALDFSGVDQNEETSKTLKNLGFRRVDEMNTLIRRWYSGEYRATHTERSRSLLDQFLPRLIRDLADASDPDDAFVSFDRFLAQLPNGIQIFSLFVNNPTIFTTLLEILTISPRLGNALSRQQGFVEALIEGGWISLDQQGSLLQSLQTELGKILDVDFEDTLNITRRFVGEARFQSAVRLATMQGDPIETASVFSKIAEAAISTITPAAYKEMTRQYGEIAGELCVVGFGRLGASRMTYTSDIDVVFVYDTPGDAVSNGKRSIDGVTWFTRMVRRMVTGLSVPTEEGQLYEVDMQLRPSGGAGPAAVKLSAFQKYYDHDAWIWELMALTKARVVFGPENLSKKIQSIIEVTLCKERKPSETARAVLEMRQRLLRENPPISIWDRKSTEGGLTDIEFILQYLILTNAAKLGLPPQEVDAMCKFYVDANVIQQGDADIIVNAFHLNDTILHLSRLGAGAVFSPEVDGQALCSRIWKVCGAETYTSSLTRIEESQKLVKQVFERVLILGS